MSSPASSLTSSTVSLVKHTLVNSQKTVKHLYIEIVSATKKLKCKTRCSDFVRFYFFSFCWFSHSEMDGKRRKRTTAYVHTTWLNVCFQAVRKGKGCFSKINDFRTIASFSNYVFQLIPLDRIEVLVLNAHFPISTYSIIDFNCFNKSLIILQRRVNEIAKLSVTFAFISWIQQVHTKCSNCILKPPQPLSHKLYTTCWACKSSRYSCILPIT